MSGKLFVVSTPIGNLEDITLRAINILRDCDLIACEDTRITKKLLTRYEVKTDYTSYHEHNEIEKSSDLLDKLKKGKNVALVSDAGTPLISDPGWRIIKLSIENDIKVVPVPGASAAISALVVSGLPTESFLFLGFLSKNAGKKKKLIEEIKRFSHTLVFYESAGRLSDTLSTLLEILGDRPVCVAREITKLHEEAIRGSLSEVISTLGQTRVKGEVTVVLEGERGTGEEISAQEARDMLISYKRRGIALSEAVRDLCDCSKISKNSAYRVALEVWDD